MKKNRSEPDRAPETAPGTDSAVPDRSGLDGQPLLDPGELAQLKAALRPDSLAKVFDQFCQELKQRRTRLLQAVAAGDLSEVRAQAHGLHGAAAAIGAARLAAQMAEIELALKNDPRGEDLETLDAVLVCTLLTETAICAVRPLLR